MRSSSLRSSHISEHASQVSMLTFPGPPYGCPVIVLPHVGHANPRLLEALRGVLDESLLHTYAYVNEPRARYYDKLIAFAPAHLDKAFLLSAGTEAQALCSTTYLVISSRKSGIPSAESTILKIVDSSRGSEVAWRTRVALASRSNRSSARLDTCGPTNQSAANG